MAKKQEPKEMSFLDHLEELRWHLIRSTMAVVIIGCVAFAMSGYIFDNIICYRLVSRISTGIDNRAP
mgnify:CR=1 FL=1